MRMRAHPAAITRRLFLRLVAFAGGALGLSAGASPRPATASADAGTPRLAERAPAPVAQQPIRVALSIHEGTNMAAAVAPDGRTVAIDLLSVLWLVPADGGEARRLTDDFQDVAQPDWAPDGESLVFQSYRDGNYHLWSIARDGTNLKQLTSGPFDHREPQFSPDGRAIAFSSDRSGSYDVWVLDLASGEMTQRTAGPADRSQPAWSPDGRELAFVVDGTGLAVLDLAGNERTLARVDAEDRLSAPTWAPDGSGLLYTLGTAGESRLVLAGEPITSGEDVFPFRAAWLSPSEILYTADGKIRRRSLDDGSTRDVAFTAAVAFDRVPYQRRRRDFSATGPQPVRGLVSPAVDPDGQRIAFVALNQLWVMPIGGKPERLTEDTFFKADPAWSPDGQWLAYSTDRAGGMDVWVREVATGREWRATAGPMAAVGSAWSPDGSQIAFVDNTGAIDVVSVATGEIRQVHERLFYPGRPTWSADGQTIALAAIRPSSRRFREGANQILALHLASGDERYHVPLAHDPHSSIAVRYDQGPVWSPDGTRMALVSEGVLWVVAVDARGQPTGEASQLTEELADAPSWTGDSRQILYVANGVLRMVSTDGGPPRTIPLDLTWSHAQPAGRTVIHAGRLWDGRGATLREAVDVVVEGNRIVAVAPHDAAAHTGRVIDASNLTLMPGLVESHTHVQMEGKHYGDRQGRMWLAYGITTVRNPSSQVYRAIENREAIDAGARVGPRTFTTGEGIDGSRIYYDMMRPVTSDAQLELELDRVRAMDYDLVKTYVRLPFSRQKAVVEWAHAHGIPVSSHYLYPAVAFGIDAIEHMGATSRLGYPQQKSSRLSYSYQDFVELVTQSGITLTPTLAQSRVLLARDLARLEDERVQTLFPAWAIADVHAAIRRLVGPDPAVSEEALARQGKTLQAIVRGGGRVIAGTDAPLDTIALSFHSNLRAMVQYGLTPLEALRTATSAAADALGAGEDLGTIEPGKLADLVFVAGDPLVDVGAAANVRRVMQNGVLYDVADLLAPFRALPEAPAPGAAGAPRPAPALLARRAAHAAHWWEDPSFWEDDCYCHGGFA